MDRRNCKLSVVIRSLQGIESVSKFSGVSSKARSIFRSTRPAHRIIFLYALLTSIVVASTFGEGISQTLATLQSVLVALAAVGGVVVAAEGLDTWHRQIRGRDDYDLALKLQTAVFRLRDLLTSARALRREEAHSATEKSCDPDSEAERYVTLTPAWQHEEYLQEIFSAIDDVRKVGREAQVLWWNEIDHLLVPFLNYAFELTNYIGYLKAKDKPPPAGVPDPPWDEWFGNERNPIKPGDSRLENDFQLDVRRTADEIRNHLAKYLDR